MWRPLALALLFHHLVRPFLIFFLKLSRLKDLVWRIVLHFVDVGRGCRSLPQRLTSTFQIVDLQVRGRPAHEVRSVVYISNEIFKPLGLWLSPHSVALVGTVRVFGETV